MMRTSMRDTVWDNIHLWESWILKRRIKIFFTQIFMKYSYFLDNIYKILIYVFSLYNFTRVFCIQTLTILHALHECEIDKQSKILKKENFFLTVTWQA